MVIKERKRFSAHNYAFQSCCAILASDCLETNNSGNETTAKSTNMTHSSVHSNIEPQRAGWRVVETDDYDSSLFMEAPDPVQGYILKKRRLPKVGWHPLFFYLDEGKLYCARNRLSMANGKRVSKIHLRSSILSYNYKKCRIELDTPIGLLHLKLNNAYPFDVWFKKFIEHVVYACTLYDESEPSMFFYLPKTKEIDDLVDYKEADKSITMPTRINELEKQLLQFFPDVVKTRTEDSSHKRPSEISGIFNEPGMKPMTHINRVSSHETNDLDDDEDKLGNNQHADNEFLALGESFYNHMKMANKGTDNWISTPKKKVEPPLKYNFMLDETFENDNSDDSDSDKPIDEGVSKILEQNVSDAIDNGLTKENEVRDAAEKVKKSRNTFGRRTVLPTARPVVKNFRLINVLEKNVGLDLRKLHLPIAVHEPLTGLQRLCEELEYSQLLTMAADEDDAQKRMMYITAFAISVYSHHRRRDTSLPLNPLIHETFECARPERGWRFIAEHISHDPQKSVAFTDHDKWTLEQESGTKTYYWGRSLEVNPTGGYKLFLKNRRETYYWSKVSKVIENVSERFNKRSVEFYGDKCIVCKETGLKTFMKFLKKDEVHNGVRGEVPGKRNIKLEGKWCTDITNVTSQPNICIWEATPLPSNADTFYGFTKFAIELNEEIEINEVDSGKVPITDSRLRPDLRFLEYGNLLKAQNKKEFLENRQVEIAKKTESPIKDGYWFKKIENPDGVEPLTYKFTNQYWEEKNNGGFLKLKLPNIYLN